MGNPKELNKKKLEFLRLNGINVKVDGSWGPWQEEQYKKLTTKDKHYQTTPLGYLSYLYDKAFGETTYLEDPDYVKGYSGELTEDTRSDARRWVDHLMQDNKTPLGYVTLTVAPAAATAAALVYGTPVVVNGVTKGAPLLYNGVRTAVTNPATIKPALLTGILTGLGYLGTLPGTVAGNFIGDAAGSMALGMGLEEGQRAAFGRSAGDIVYNQLKPYIGDFGANMARPEYIISPSMVLKNTYTLAANNLGKLYANQTVKLVKKPSKNVLTQNTLSSHLLGEEAVKMFKQYGGVEIPEGSINGQQLRMYVPEARTRYGLVGNKNITDEEIALALYKHSTELGEGSAAKNILGEPLLLFRGDTKRYTELKPRITPEELAKGGGTMDNSLGTLFLGELPSLRGGLERYIATIRDFRGVKRLVGSGTGSRAKLPNGDIVKEYVNDEIAVIPEGSYLLFSQPIRQDNISVYKLPASLTETGVNDINAFIVRTPNMRDATREISVLNDDFLVLNGPKVDYYGPVRRLVLDKDGFPLLVDEKGTVVGNGLAGSSERSAMAEHYQQVLNKALAEQLGLLKSNKNSYLRDEHSGYDYFALPNFNIRGAKHLLPYDLRIPRNWKDSNVYRTLIPVGVTTYGITNND